MKIYTKTGDQGETGLLGGKRVSKTHPCVEVCGGLDELNSWLGAIRSKLPQGVIESGLRPVQNDLFCIGTTVAGCMGCLLYTSPSPRDGLLSRMPSSA